MPTPVGTDPAQAPATGAEGGDETKTPEVPNPTETVEYWKGKARDWESKSKANKTAAEKLAAIEESSKTDDEKRVEREAKMQAEVDSVPSKVAMSLRNHLIARHEIEADDAELFLTGTTPELILKQVDRLIDQSAGPKGNRVSKEGTNSRPKPNSTSEFLGALTGAE